MGESLFVGLPVPESRRYQDVAHDATRWSAQNAGQVGVPPVHIVDVDGPPAQVMNALRKALAKEDAFQCEVRGLVARPEPRKARTLWAGLDAPGLHHLAATIRIAARPWSKFAIRDKAHQDHVLISRLGKATDLRSLVEANNDARFARGAIDKVALYARTMRDGVVGQRMVGMIPLRSAA